MILYKYLAEARHNLLTTRLVRFSQPSVLNDVLEARPHFASVLSDEAATKRIDEAVPDGILAGFRDSYDALPNERKAALTFDDYCSNILSHPEAVEELRIAWETGLARFKAQLAAVAPEAATKVYADINNKVGILCLSATPAHHLMWAHYASAHRGFCIGFDSTHPYFSRRRSPLDDCYHLRQVTYETPRRTHPSLANMTAADFFLVKGIDWAYEQEWRLLAPLEDATSLVGDLALFSFPSSAVSEVVLGQRMAPVARESILSALRDPAYSHARVSVVTLNPATGLLGLTPLATPSID